MNKIFGRLIGLLVLVTLSPFLLLIAILFAVGYPALDAKHKQLVKAVWANKSDKDKVEAILDDFKAADVK
jgi:hypothetical protein